MNKFTRLLAPCISAVLLALPLAAGAQGMAKPLVILRFNQPHVYFDQQLYGAISQAVAVKPDVMFDVVSYAPSTGNPELDQKWQATSSHNTQAVVASMQQMGVPLSRIQITGQNQPGLKFDETHVYVR